MAEERELTPLQTLQTAERSDGRWPVPYALLCITGISVTLWALIIAVAHWLLG